MGGEHGEHLFGDVFWCDKHKMNGQFGLFFKIETGEQAFFFNYYDIWFSFNWPLNRLYIVFLTWFYKCGTVHYPAKKIYHQEKYPARKIDRQKIHRLFVGRIVGTVQPSVYSIDIPILSIICSFV